jgi:hypothetical protein
VSGTNYILDTFICSESKDNKIPPSIGFHFKNIVHSSQIRDLCFGRFPGDGIKSTRTFQLKVDNLTTDDIRPVLLYTEGIPSADLCHLGPNCLGNLKSNFENYIDYIRPVAGRSDSTNSFLPAVVTYDSGGIAKNHLVGRMVSRDFFMGNNTTNMPQLCAAIIPITGKYMNVRYKAQHDITFSYYNILSPSGGFTGKYTLAATGGA